MCDIVEIIEIIPSGSGDCIVERDFKIVVEEIDSTNCSEPFTIGLWWWTWSPECVIPQGTNIGTFN